MRVCARLLFICHLLVNLSQRKHLNKAASKWNRWWRCDSKFNTRNLHTNFHTDFTDYTEAMACRFSAGITIFSFFSLLTYTFLTWPIQIWFKGRKPLLRWCRRLVYIAACAVWFRCRCSFCHKIYEYSTRWLKSALNWQTSYPSSSFFQSSRGEIDEKPNDFRSALAGAEAKKKTAFVRRINKAVASQVLTDKCSLTLIAGLEGYISRKLELIWLPATYTKSAN